MEKKALEKISFWNSNKYEMQARLFKGNSDELLLYIVGIGGTYGVFGNLLSDLAMQNDTSFLWPMFEDTHDKRTTRRINSNGSLEEVVTGATWASLKNLQSEYDALLDYIKKNCFKKISIVAVCGGCSKVIYYMLNNPEFKNMVSNLVLLAPEDYKLIEIHPKNLGMKEEAIDNLLHSGENKVLSKQFMGYMDMSSKTYLEYLYLKKYNTLPYYDTKSDLSYLKKIDMPVKIYMGQYDRSIKDEPDGGIERLTHLTNGFSNAQYAIVSDSVHLFYDKEVEVVKSIAEFLNYKHIKMEGEKDYV